MKADDAAAVVALVFLGLAGVVLALSGRYDLATFLAVLGLFNWTSAWGMRK